MQPLPHFTNSHYHISPHNNLLSHVVSIILMFIPSANATSKLAADGAKAPKHVAAFVYYYYYYYYYIGLCVGVH
jgi:hypothetical protein